MKTKAQIKEIARQASIDFHQYENNYFIITFSKAYTQAQKDLLESASEGFEWWYIKNNKDFPVVKNQVGLRQFNLADMEKAWQASRLGMMKENEELKKLVSDCEHGRDAWKNRCLKAENEIKQLKEDLAKYDSALVRYLDAEDMSTKRSCDKESEVAINEVRKRNGIDKEKV